jgi:hypothetical protein
MAAQAMGQLNAIPPCGRLKHGSAIVELIPDPLLQTARSEIAATLLKIDGLIMPGLVELCTPHLVHALVVGPAEDHGRAEPNVEVAQIFQSPD